jgi:hypothetical protein
MGPVFHDPKDRSRLRRRGSMVARLDGDPARWWPGSMVARLDG